MEKHVLLVDDDNSFLESIALELRDEPYSLHLCQSTTEAREFLAQENADVVLTDLNMPSGDGIEFCSWLSDNRPGVPVIVLTAFGSLESAVEALRAGAYDFLSKPIDGEILLFALRRALSTRELQEKIHLLNEAVSAKSKLERLIGESEAIQNVRKTIQRVAAVPSSVLITGESGTGKEVVAGLLHQNSSRNEKPMVVVNCAAMPDSLLESELFGHQRGAFTGAVNDRKGLFMEADGGTILLDEIGELPLPLQAKLLRAIESRCVRPIGGKETPFDARIFAATNSVLSEAVSEGSFRSDLYFRLNVIHIHIPPVRERGTDVVLLARYFVDEFSKKMGKDVKGITTAVQRALIAYSWPGNVREVRNVIERAIVFAAHDQLTLDDLPDAVRAPGDSSVGVVGEFRELITLHELQDRYIKHVLDVTKGNRSQAARILGVNRRTLYRRLGGEDDATLGGEDDATLGGEDDATLSLSGSSG